MGVVDLVGFGVTIGLGLVDISGIIQAYVRLEAAEVAPASFSVWVVRNE